MIARLGFAFGVVALLGAALSQLHANDALDFWHQDWQRRQTTMTPQPTPWGSPAPWGAPWAAPPTAITVTPRPSRRPTSRARVERREHAHASDHNGPMFCVRTCDGFYMPVAAGLSKAEAQRSCNALCPGTETILFRGGEDGPDGIGQAVSHDGKRYASLTKAFAYRAAVDNNCRCGARPKAVLAQLRDDATLVRGDIVVTEAGVHVFTGRGRPPHDAGDFTPYREAGRLSGKLRTYLSEIDRAYASAPERLAQRAATDTRAADKRDDKAERRAERRPARREAARGELSGKPPVLAPTAVTVGRVAP
jgi:hypothetical protein